MFTRGQSYVRRDIHAELGGQAQGGISTPAQHPVIIIFTGEEGEQYGYRDGWTEDGVFLYTGEGQRGDMEFVRGNRAIRDHISEGKELHLFKIIGGGIVRYRGEMIYTGFERRAAPDIEGDNRSAIIFELLPIDAFDLGIEDSDDALKELNRIPMEELRRRALEESNEPRPPRESKQASHYRSSAVRAYVLRRADGICEGCGDPAPFVTAVGRLYLEPHHIRRVSDGGPDHPEWVAGVCPNCHSRAHYSGDKQEFNSQLRDTVLKMERQLRQNA